MYLAPLNYDRFFKKVFADETIAKQFLSDFLGIEIESLKKLERKHKFTNDAAYVEFDFRCKIAGKFVIIDMQQWYKPDISQRFYLYHALNTGLQLEDLPKTKIIADAKTNQVREISDYRSVEPVITLIWMADDNMGFETEEVVSYAMTPEVVTEFLKDEKLWHEPEIVELLEERLKVKKTLENRRRGLGFLGDNRLIFAFQNNIIKNPKLTGYLRWFHFAERTRNVSNAPEDFEEFVGDPIFDDMIHRLNRSELTDKDLDYIERERDNWLKVKRFEEGWYEEGWEEGIEIGEERGIKIGEERGIKIGEERGVKIGEERGVKIGAKNKTIEIAKNLMSSGVLSNEQIAQTTGLSIEEVEALSSSDAYHS